MKFRNILFRKRYKERLQLFLAASLFLYLYSPLLDHWLGNTHYGRPHTHITISSITLVGDTAHDQAELNESEHEAHEESVLCLLDMNSLLSVSPDIDLQWSCFWGFAKSSPLVFNVDAGYDVAGSIFLSSLDPPPRA